MDTASSGRKTAEEYLPKHLHGKKPAQETQANGAKTRGNQSEYSEQWEKLKTIRGTEKKRI